MSNMERKNRQQLKKRVLFDVIKAAKTENTNKNRLLVLSRQI